MWVYLVLQIVVGFHTGAVLCVLEECCGLVDWLSLQKSKVFHTLVGLQTCVDLQTVVGFCGLADLYGLADRWVLL